MEIPKTELPRKELPKIEIKVPKKIEPPKEVKKEVVIPKVEIPKVEEKKELPKIEIKIPETTVPKTESKFKKLDVGVEKVPLAKIEQKAGGSDFLDEDEEFALFATEAIFNAPSLIWGKHLERDQEQLKKFSKRLSRYCKKKGISLEDYYFEELGLVVSAAGIVNGMRADHAAWLREQEKIKSSDKVWDKNIDRLKERDLLKEKAEIERMLKEKDEKEIKDKADALAKIKADAPKLEEELRTKALGVEEQDKIDVFAKKP